ncbi:SCO family protein [Myxococcaceae bacterium GXIMD 01537]
MSPDASAAPPPSSPSKKPAVWAAVVVGALVLPLLVLGVVRARPQEPLPRLGALPAFSFTRQDGQPFGLAQLKGRAWVANFIFTRCPTICPLFTQKFKGVQEATADLGERLPLVSFSVDPDYDTPERLDAYAKKHGARPERWSFLTGDYKLLKDTVVDGFKVAMGREEGVDPKDLLSIFHGEHFVLVDADGEIRGYYISNDAEAVEQLVRDARRLVEAGGR